MGIRCVVVNSVLEPVESGCYVRLWRWWSMVVVWEVVVDVKIVGGGRAGCCVVYEIVLVACGYSFQWR